MEPDALQDRSAHRGLGNPVGLSGVIAAAVLLFAFDPAATWWFPSCPSHALTGWLCPFCGSLRAVHALLRGAPLVASQLNPLTTAGLVAALAALLHDSVCPGRATQLERLTRFCFSARGLAIVAAFGLLRNMASKL
jgi:Protein of unknown function (DUF2752)